MNAGVTSSSSRTQGFALALLGTFLWSSTAIFIRYLTQSYQLPPLVLAFWRELLVSLGLIVLLGVFRPGLLRPPRRHLPFLLAYGFLLMLFNTTWTVSVAVNGAAVATVLAYSSPAITAVLAWFLWKESLGPAKIVAVLLSLGGCLLVSGALSAELWKLNPLGIAIGLVTGFMFAGYSIFGREASRRELRPWGTLSYTFGFATIFMFLLLQVPLGRWVPAMSGVGGREDLLWLGADLTGWGIVLVLALGPTLGGYGLYTASLAHLPASVANLIASLEPPIAAGLAYLLLGERLTGLQVVGSLMIVGGVFLLRIREGRIRA